VENRIPTERIRDMAGQPLGGKAGAAHAVASATAGAVEYLQQATITDCRMVWNGSNSVFLVALSGKRENRLAENRLAIYKPRKGEAPLWDFPDGTLYRRERAAYLVSEFLGWGIVPPTVIRKGPYGVGALQWYISSKSRQLDYYALLERNEKQFRKIAVFDLLVNNADRKAGHCLVSDEGRIWAIDHGLTFHADPKLRTIIWDFGGQSIPRELISDLSLLKERMNRRDRSFVSLSQLVSAGEVQAFLVRLKAVLDHPVFPMWSGSHRSIPWPPF
jgi:uncharacterized repeat protein (TIGR03843 family)